MEEVWKDITITSLPNTPIPHHYNTHHPNPTSNSNLRGMILQDFLNSRDPPNRVPNSSIYGGPPPPPTTALSLNSGLEFQFLDVNNQRGQLQSNPVANFGGLGTGEGTFDPLASSSVLNPFGVASGKEQFPEIEENGTVDRRRKRMIKNRESAARSRARKQAYITELQHEVTHLQAENDRLRKQLHQIQVYAAPVAHQLPKSHGLRRTSTAPF